MKWLQNLTEDEQIRVRYALDIIEYFSDKRDEPGPKIDLFVMAKMATLLDKLEDLVLEDHWNSLTFEEILSDIRKVFIDDDY